MTEIHLDLTETSIDGPGSRRATTHRPTIVGRESTRGPWICSNCGREALRRGSG